MSDTMEKPIADLIVDPRCQARECMDEQALAEYADAYRAGEALPPLGVFEVEAELVIVDGFHRHEAAKRAGVATLPVRTVGKGSMADAEWHALGSNQKHGLRRTCEDKRRAVWLALDLGDDRSNREIAKHIGVSHTFVANLKRVEQQSSLPREWLYPNLVRPESVEAAALVDVTPRMVERARRLAALVPKLGESVWRGETTLDKAEWLVGIALREAPPLLDGHDDDRQRLSLAILAECRPDFAATDHS